MDPHPVLTVATENKSKPSQKKKVALPLLLCHSTNLSEACSIKANPITRCTSSDVLISKKIPRLKNPS
jgi:hypothetical protein